MKIQIFIILILALVLGGCAGQREPAPAATAPIPAPDVVCEPAVRGKLPQQETGSLWQNGQQGSMFMSNKACRPGDILTVVIYEQAKAEKEAATATGRSSSVSMGISKLFGLEASLVDKNPSLDPAALLNARSENDFEGSGSTSRAEKLSATLTTRVVEVVDAGNLRIEGSKTVRVNNEDQIIRLSGIVRPADIAANNIIDSKYILDAEIEYFGNGVISEKQRPGWLTRILDIIWPF